MPYKEHAECGSHTIFKIGQHSNPHFIFCRYDNIYDMCMTQLESSQPPIFISARLYMKIKYQCVSKLVLCTFTE